MTTSVSSGRTRSARGRQASAKWRSGLSRLPGYDPFASAGDCWFDARTAQGVIDFFDRCITHVKGEKARQPFVLEPWQRAIVATLTTSLNASRIAGT